jgi:hypothetical protein
MKKTLYSLATFLAVAFQSQAQEAADSSDTKGTFTFSGYVDTYYFKNLNNPLSGYNYGSSGFARVFDQKEGQFQLGLVQTKITYANSKSEAVVDLTFGPNADLGNYGNVISLNGAAGTSTALAIKQAYFTYKPTDKLSFTAGQFGTHIGYEVIDAPVNFHYSLSNLFGNGPFFHLGVKGNYAISDKVGVMVGLVNNWDSNLDNNKFKTAIAQVSVSPVEGWTAYFNWIGGDEDAADSVGINADPEKKSFKQMFDLTTSYQITEKFLLGLNAAYGIYKKEDKDATTWGGVALYANYAITDKFGLGVRAEHFDNTAGVQYLKTFDSGTDVTSITATGNITLANGHLFLKPEIRMDKAKKSKGSEMIDLQQFEDNSGKFTKDSQTTIGAAVIYKF